MDRRTALATTTTLLGALVVACGGASPPPAESVECAKDTDCKGTRICVSGECAEADGGSGGADAEGSTGAQPDGAPDATLNDASNDAARDASDGGCAVGTLSCNSEQPTICAGSETWQNVGAPCSGSTPACSNGACVQCQPGSTQCSAPTGSIAVQTCNATAHWESPVTCPPTSPDCSQGVCASAWSC